MSYAGGRPEMPKFTFHGSSVHPDVILANGVRTNADLRGKPPHFDIGKHVHNSNTEHAGRSSGFVSTSGDLNAAMQFVGFKPGNMPVKFGDKSYFLREGWVYVAKPSASSVHVPSLKNSGLEHFARQDEWAHIGNIKPSQIDHVIPVKGYFDTKPNKSGGVDTHWAPGSNIDLTAKPTSHYTG